MPGLFSCFGGGEAQGQPTETGKGQQRQNSALRKSPIQGTPLANALLARPDDPPTPVAQGATQRAVEQTLSGPPSTDRASLAEMPTIDGAPNKPPVNTKETVGRAPFACAPPAPISQDNIVLCTLPELLSGVTLNTRLAAGAFGCVYTGKWKRGGQQAVWGGWQAALIAGRTCTRFVTHSLCECRPLFGHPCGRQGERRNGTALAKNKLLLGQ